MTTPYPGHDPQHPQQPPYPGVPGAPQGGSPYGEPGYGVPPYGSPAYGAPGSPPGYGPTYSPDIRPLTVTIAVWIAIALSALSILAGLGGVLGASALVDYMRENPDEAGLSPSDMENLDDAKLGFAVIGIGLILCSIIAIAVAVFVLKRHNWARITLVAMAGITTLVGLVGTFAVIFGILWLIGAVAVIILLFVGGANEWFGRSGGSPWGGQYGPPPYQQGGHPAPYQQGPYQQGPYQQGPPPQPPYQQGPPHQGPYGR